MDAPRIRDIIATVLDGGRLAVPRLDAAVTITAGQASIGQTSVLGQGADLAISGNADLADASIDARLTLTGPTIHEGANAIRPEILVTLRGPYSAPKRSIDVSALSGWLMLRSVERQAKQISAIEAERREIERREAERRDAERVKRRSARQRDWRLNAKPLRAGLPPVRFRRRFRFRRSWKSRHPSRPRARPGRRVHGSLLPSRRQRFRLR